MKEAIETTPCEINVYNRNGERAMLLKEWNCYYGTGSDCVNTIDLYSGMRKISKKEDIAKLARFCDILPNIDFFMSFGIANDAPDGSNFIHQYEAMLLNTSKPIIVTGHGRNDITAIINMAAAAVGGIDNLKKQNHLLFYIQNPCHPSFIQKWG